MTSDNWQLEYLQRLPTTFEVGGGYWWKVEVRSVEVTPYRPHGIKYSLTLHDQEGKRIFGIDNAHAITKKEGFVRKRLQAFDHTHKGKQVTFYEYRTASDLVDDFFDAVDVILTEQGVNT